MLGEDVAQPEKLALAVGLREREGEPLAEGVPLTSPLPLLLPEPEPPAREGVGPLLVASPVREGSGDALCEGVGEAVLLVETLAEGLCEPSAPLAVTVDEAVPPPPPLEEGHILAVADPFGDDEASGEAVLLRLAEEQPETDAEPDGAPLREGEWLLLRVAEGVPLALGQRLAEGLLEPHGDAEGDPVGIPVREAQPEADDVLDGAPLCEGE